MSEWKSLTARIPMTPEEKEKNKRDRIKREAKFRKVVDAMPVLKKGYDLKVESEEEFAKKQAEKTFLLKGVAEGRVKSARLLKMAKGFSGKRES